MGVFSGLLWLRAALSTTEDKLSNAAAAVFSGATALFSAGASSFPPAFAAGSPWWSGHWAIGAFFMGLFVVVTCLFTVWSRWLR